MYLSCLGLNQRDIAIKTTAKEETVHFNVSLMTEKIRDSLCLAGCAVPSSGRRIV
jgi:hypothetical protein